MVFSNKKLEEISIGEPEMIDTAAQFVAGFLCNRESNYQGKKLMPDFRETIKRGSVSRAIPDCHETVDRSSADLIPNLSDPGFNQKKDYIYINPRPEKEQIGIAGFDLRVGRFIGRSDVVMNNVTKKDLEEMPHQILDPGEPYIFHPNADGENVYYVTSFEKIILSSNLEMLIDSKSTTGRVGCMSHRAGKTESGELITIVQPFSFPLKVECGKTKLSQAIVRYRGTDYMGNEEILKSEEIGVEGDGVSLKNSLTARGLLMKFNTKMVYRAKSCEEPIDMDVKRELDWKKYFDLIEGNSSIVTDKKTLYLLGSLGVINLNRVCGLLSREQEVITGTGAWGHFAGVFQPFFKGGITMEFYSYSKRRVCRGDDAGVVIFDKVEGEIVESYEGAYQGQKSPALPKMFKIE